MIISDKNTNNCYINYDIKSDNYSSEVGLILTKSIFSENDGKVDKYITSNNTILSNIFLLRVLEELGVDNSMTYDVGIEDSKIHSLDMKCKDKCKTKLCEAFVNLSFDLRFNLSYYCCSYKICNNINNIKFSDELGLYENINLQYSVYGSMIPLDILYKSFYKIVENKVSELHNSIPFVKFLHPIFYISFDLDKNIIEIMENSLDFEVKLSIESNILVKISDLGVTSKKFNTNYIGDLSFEYFLSNYKF